jgi:hypothetical protein
MLFSSCIASPASCQCGALAAILKVCSIQFCLVRSAVFDAEAHIPTQPSSPLKDARISFSHEDQERAGGVVAPARQGTQARLGKGWPPRVSQKTGGTSSYLAFGKSELLRYRNFSKETRGAAARAGCGRKWASQADTEG